MPQTRMLEDLMTPELTVYSTTWCGYCTRLKRQLDRAQVSFAEVNIEHDRAAAKLVMEVNGGSQTVPTVIFTDGTALTNPSLAQVTDHLRASTTA